MYMCLVITCYCRSCITLPVGLSEVLQAPAVQRVGNAVDWINHYQMDSVHVVCFANIYMYPQDSDDLVYLLDISVI